LGLFIQFADLLYKTIREIYIKKSEIFWAPKAAQHHILARQISPNLSAAVDVM